MKHSKLVLISLSIVVVLLGIVIFAQVYENVKEIENVAAESPYQYDINGEPRVFQLEKMVEAFKKAEEEFAKGKITYVDNYKNQNGYAPYYRGQAVDAAGTGRSASAPGYMDISDKDEFIYIPDGTLVRVIEEKPDFTQAVLIKNGKEYFIPGKYVRTEHYLTDLNKAIAIDVSNQNIAVFEKRPEGWTVVSYSLATTGKTGAYHQPTPLGYFYAIQKRERFYYVKDGTDEIEGYAPYAVRFTAGAYIHGISTAYQYAEDGTRIDPGIQEFSDTIGTVPLSHMCVRTYTSHAKFIYDWFVHRETIVVVLD